MKRSDKEQLVIELKDKMKGATALYFTDFTGINVKKIIVRPCVVTMTL